MPDVSESLSPRGLSGERDRVACRTALLSPALSCRRGRRGSQLTTVSSCTRLVPKADAFETNLKKRRSHSSDKHSPDLVLSVGREGRGMFVRGINIPANLHPSALAWIWTGVSRPPFFHPGCPGFCLISSKATGRNLTDETEAGAGGVEEGEETAGFRRNGGRTGVFLGKFRRLPGSLNAVCGRREVFPASANIFSVRKIIFSPRRSLALPSADLSKVKKIIFLVRKMMGGGRQNIFRPRKSKNLT